MKRKFNFTGRMGAFKNSSPLQCLLVTSLLISGKLDFVLCKVVGNDNTCDFNKLCTCTEMSHHITDDEEQGGKVTLKIIDVICLGAPMSSLPDFRNNSLYRVKIVGATNIQIIEDNAFWNTTVASFTIAGTKLSVISKTAFAGLDSSLTSLEITYTNIRDLTFLSQVPSLLWLNVKSNKIHDISSGDFSNVSELRSLILSDNYITGRGNYVY